ncbi:RNA polymerase sigma factor [Rossellomorea sp. KS-H15a]|uniref:RNA polymerase sigma factor n=1 Tax=Rossellomorea sp. KS-H15a TaxID=2963940 RepID=UPI0020C66591|nr:RNA polymerase sigma factor [Rossellomorea sp. KS-H15a]UTE78067.1 RNA polymerase sigma factor [Rossellomorea sp. KS-H15a]
MDTLNTSSSPLTIEEVYEQYHKLIYHIAYNITKDVHLSQDVSQETFLKAYIKMDTLEDPAKIKSWLTTIAKCTAIDIIRQRSRRNETCIEEHEEFHSIEEHRSLEDEIDALFLKSSIQDHITSLPLTQQEVMALKVTEDLSDSEIATKLNLPPSTVKTRFHRARKQLYTIVQTKISA